MTPKELKVWRESQKLTQGDLGKALGVTLTTVYRWEAGFRKIPPFLQLALEGWERRMGEKDPKGQTRKKGGGGR